MEKEGDLILSYSLHSAKHLITWPVIYPVVFAFDKINVQASAMVFWLFVAE